MIIDFHNHLYPDEYLRELKKGKTQTTLSTNAGGRTVLFVPGDYNILEKEHYDTAPRLKAMNKAGVDMQVLSFTMPGVHTEKRQTGIRLAQVINNAFAGIIEKHPTRFAALAALPLQDVGASVREMRRTVTSLKLKGCTLFTNINGRYLDHSSFIPLFENAAELDIPLFIHPYVPPHISGMADYRLVALAGFLHETVVCISRMVFAGVCEKFPSLKIIVAHMGGYLPYAAERMNLGFNVYAECRKNISRPPGDYLKRLYMDTIPFAADAIRFAIAFAGEDRILLGSDYPHRIGNLSGAVETIRNLHISEKSKRCILGKNTAELLKIKTILRL